MLRSFIKKQSMLLAIVLTFLVFNSSIQAKEKTSKILKRWEKDISRFETMDQENPPPKNPILFTGASNFRRWDVKKSFPNLPVMNRGFGGSMISENIHFMDRIITPYKPRTIILYGGANDMSRGRKSPEQVLKDYRQFVKLVHKEMPKTRIVFLSLPHFYKDRDNPEEIAKVDKVNKIILAETVKDNRLDFAKVNKAMADKNGNPRKELFIKDGVHVTQAGYNIWAEILRPYMTKEN